MTKRIHIFAMKTWGELGNVLAARTLAKTISAEVPQIEIEVFEAESFFPTLARIGSDIRRLSRESPNARIRQERYMQLVRQLETVFLPDFELGSPSATEFGGELNSLRQHFARSKPDLVIGTKGVISRLCVGAMREAEHSAPIFNYVTNHGLLGLNIHRASHVQLHLVQFERAKSFLVDRLGFKPESVRIVGPLIAGGELKHSLVDKSMVEGPSANGREMTGQPDQPLLVVFCNRGGEEYLKLLEYLAERHSGTEVLFIAHNDREMITRAERIKQATQQRWRLYERMSQDEYIRQITKVSNSSYPVLIAKSGPNTVLEAAYFGMPVMVLSSGLPMEEWVVDLIREKGLGHAAETAEEWLSVLGRWLLDWRVIAQHKDRVTSFRQSELDQSQTALNIGRVIRETLNLEFA